MRAAKKSRMGPPKVDSELLRARVERQTIDALDAYVSDEALTRPQAIRAILADWLRTHGYGPAAATKPEGPATKVVEAMDTAIKEHRKTRRATKAR